MSSEVFQMVQAMDLSNIATQFVMQCAPVIAGEKASNLLIIPNISETFLENVIQGSELMYYRLYRNTYKTTYLVFNRSRLENYLKDEAVLKVFREQGYSDLHIGKMLRRFQKRYTEHMKNPEKFPHEMGLVLGYPVEDVVGFIENKGKNFLYSGYWKVYGNVRETINTFDRYDEVTREQMSMLCNGMMVEEIVAFYEISNMERALDTKAC